MELLSKTQYEEQIAATRDKRMDWWRQARFGMFVHYGLYTLLGTQEWAMARENFEIEEYEKLVDDFKPNPDAPRQWAQLAKEAGMKYMVMTTRHHEGFSLWDSKTNPYNSVNMGPNLDLVAKFVDACREFDLKIGFYSSLMDWHHPDSWKCAFDSQARMRFNDYIKDLNTELLTNYGKIDILWYDVPAPMLSWEGWNSLEINQHLRSIQPDIIINNRSKLDEDFGTPEGHIEPMDRDWEACMTFNDISWGYVDSTQAKPYSYNAQGILKMVHTCSERGGNLLLNIGPAPDGSVPTEAVEPLETVGKWLNENGKAVYGHLDKLKVKHAPFYNPSFYANGVSTATKKDNSIYIWNRIWPTNGQMTIAGFMTRLKAAKLLKDGSSINFTQDGHRIFLKDLPEKAPDKHAGLTVIELQFEKDPQYQFCSYYPQLNGGRVTPKGLID